MTGRFVVAAVLFAFLAIPSAARAHEGHVHKIMGTVVAHRDHQLEVKSTDGKTAIVTLNDKTRILRGKLKAPADGIKDGERVVVSALQTKGLDGKPSMIATEVRLPETVGSK